MDMDGDKDEELTKKMEKRDMRKKKKETNAMPDLVEDDQPNKVEKKGKKKAEISSYTKERCVDLDKDAKRDITKSTIPMPNLVEDGNQPDKTEKKKKKEKKKIEVASVTSNAKMCENGCAEADGNNQNENNEKKKDKRKSEVGSETNTAEIGEKIRAEADDDNQIEKDKKKKRGRLELVFDDRIKDEIYNVEKQKMCLKVGNSRISETEGKRKERKKRRSKEEERKHKDDSGHDEVFPLEGGIVQGKRFSSKEDEMVKKSVFYYINAHDLGDEGLTMVLHCKSHSKIKNCWKEIGKALPHRPYTAVYRRAHILFERGETRTWDSEELEIIKKHHAEHGPQWKELADAMGRNRGHLSDVWRRIKLTDRNMGSWSQEEYQTLFDLVNINLREKVNEEKKSMHGMLRDNISWTGISNKLSSRNFSACCRKWYDQLTSSGNGPIPMIIA